MVRKISSSQLKSQLRQAVNKQKQAINNYNQAVRKYNQAVRTYNSRVRANKQRLNNELAKLKRQSSSTRYTLFKSSVYTLHSAYVKLEAKSDGELLGPQYDEILDLSEKENANSLEVMNALLCDDAEVEEDSAPLQHTLITNELKTISGELNDRWKGAIFSLSPRNPDAARHFCTSAREIFTQILEIKAPDDKVITLMPSCDKTDQGKPTRRAKIRYLLHQKGMTEASLEDFVEQDMDNIVQLFTVFNDGTHGSAGKFDLQKLYSIKKRVEDGIVFLSQICV
ncbi:MAG: hypothetical protein U0401_33055 [Anaerolineae bacterium]